MFWELLGIAAIALGVYAAIPQIRDSFRRHESIKGLTFSMTGALLVNNIIWIAEDIHYKLPIFALGGVCTTAVVIILIIRQIQWRTKK